MTTAPAHATAHADALTPGAATPLGTWAGNAARAVAERAQALVTPDVVAAFQRDGAVCLRQLLTPAEVALIRDGIDTNIAHPSPRAKVASQPDDPGFFIEDFCNWQHVASYRQAIFGSAMAMAAGLLMQSRRARLYHDHMLTKEPGTRQRTPWHQDQPYYNIEGRQTCSLWMPVDPVRRHSTLEFVAGSHLGPWLMPRSFMDHQARWFPEGSLADLPDVDATREQHHIIGWETEPGDVVCFHMLALHAAGGVDGDRRRRVFSVRFLGDDVRHAPRRWATSPEFAGLQDELPPGAEMDHPLFPVLWERGGDGQERGAADERMTSSALPLDAATASASASASGSASAPALASNSASSSPDGAGPNSPHTPAPAGPATL